MIPPADWEKVEQLFHEAIDLPVHQREALLASASGPVRAELESLLKADEKAFFTEPPVHLAADLLERQPAALTAGQRIGKYEIESLITGGGIDRKSVV